MSFNLRKKEGTNWKGHFGIKLGWKLHNLNLSSLMKERRCQKKRPFENKYQVILSPKLKTLPSKLVSFLAKKERRGQRKRPFGINSLLAVKHNIMLSQSRQMWTYSTTTLKAVESIFFFSLVWTGLDWAGSPPHDGQFIENQFDF